MNTLDRIINKNQDVSDKKPVPQQATQAGQQAAGTQTTGQAAVPDVIKQQQRDDVMNDANRKLAESAGAMLRKEQQDHPTPALQPEHPTPAPYVSMEELIKRMNPQLTPEEKEAERKKEKREKLFSAISDGISSLSNLYFTTQYAPNMFNPNTSASKRTRERWEKLAAQRNANMKAYLDDLMKAKMYDDNHNDNERKWQRQLALDDEERKRKDAEEKRKDAEEKRKQAAEEREKELAPLNRKLMENKISQAEYATQKSRIEAKYAEKKALSEIARNNRAGRGTSAATRAAKDKDLQDAYNYWMSLSDEEKKQYREGNKRYTKIKTGSKRDKDGRTDTYENRYQDDDDSFIKSVWKQRKAYLHNQGRDDEIATGGYNLEYRKRNSKDLTRSGRGNNGVKKSAI